MYFYLKINIFLHITGLCLLCAFVYIFVDCENMGGGGGGGQTCRKPFGSAGGGGGGGSSLCGFVVVLLLFLWIVTGSTRVAALASQERPHLKCGFISHIIIQPLHSIIYIYLCLCAYVLIIIPEATNFKNMLVSRCRWVLGSVCLAKEGGGGGIGLHYYLKLIN